MKIWKPQCNGKRRFVIDRTQAPGFYTIRYTKIANSDFNISKVFVAFMILVSILYH